MAPTTASDRKTAIITGSTSGIGLDLARDLRAKGWNVAISGRREPCKGEEIAKSIDETGEAALYCRADVSVYADQAELFRQAWAKWGRLDLFVANAGIVDEGPTSRYNLLRKDAAVDDVPPEPKLGCSDVNFKGVVYGTELAQHYMRHNKPKRGGKIIVTGSIAGLFPLPTYPEYSSAKAAVSQWVRVMAPVLKLHDDITINCVLPNGYDTAILPGFKEAYLDEHLTKRDCMMRAYFIFIDDEENSQTGQNVETAYDSLYFHERPAAKNEVVKRTEKVYEPWFEYAHGARSGLETAIKAPMRTGV
ncbi:hypothetical protein MCOR28_011765 [Pyricularia oryzae]|nr:hypothetical protein MCOR26_000284 [Pyricularia oryzae]KAI6329894.1 hypothetical protein MCOR28_011765 [Pyricularia oryzae]